MEVRRSSRDRRRSSKYTGDEYTDGEASDTDSETDYIVNRSSVSARSQNHNQRRPTNRWCQQRAHSFLGQNVSSDVDSSTPSTTPSLTPSSSGRSSISVDSTPSSSEPSSSSNDSASNSSISNQSEPTDFQNLSLDQNASREISVTPSTTPSSGANTTFDSSSSSISSSDIHSGPIRSFEASHTQSSPVPAQTAAVAGGDRRKQRNPACHSIEDESVRDIPPKIPAFTSGVKSIKVGKMAARREGQAPVCPPKVFVDRMTEAEGRVKQNSQTSAFPPRVTRTPVLANGMTAKGAEPSKLVQAPRVTTIGKDNVAVKKVERSKNPQEIYLLKKATGRKQEADKTTSAAVSQDNVPLSHISVSTGTNSPADVNTSVFEQESSSRKRSSRKEAIRHQPSLIVSTPSADQPIHDSALQRTRKVKMEVLSPINSDVDESARESPTERIVTRSQRLGRNSNISTRERVHKVQVKAEVIEDEEGEESDQYEEESPAQSAVDDDSSYAGSFAARSKKGGQRSRARRADPEVSEVAPKNNKVSSRKLATEKEKEAKCKRNARTLLERIFDKTVKPEYEESAKKAKESFLSSLHKHNPTVAPVAPVVNTEESSSVSDSDCDQSNEVAVAEKDHQGARKSSSFPMVRYKVWGGKKPVPLKLSVDLSKANIEVMENCIVVKDSAMRKSRNGHRTPAVSKQSAPVFHLPAPALARLPPMKFYVPITRNVQGADCHRFSHIPLMDHLEDDTDFVVALRAMFRDGIHGHGSGGQYLNDYMLYRLLKIAQSRWSEDVGYLYKALAALFPNKCQLEQLEGGQFERLRCRFEGLRPLTERRDEFGPYDQAALADIMAVYHEMMEDNRLRRPEKPCGDGCFTRLKNCYFAGIEGSPLDDEHMSEVLSVAELCLMTSPPLDACRLAMMLNDVCEVEQLPEKCCAEWLLLIYRSGLFDKEDEKAESKPAVNKEKLLSLRERRGRFAQVRKVIDNQAPLDPCNHSGKCSKENGCGCMISGAVCTKKCKCSINCNLRFPGCACSPGQCRSNACPCYFARWECDPETCFTCVCGSDGVNTNATSKCLNTRLRYNLQKKLKVDVSLIPNTGWGCFIMETAEKGDLISEYCGEIISHEESERRGFIYDQVHCSYLFGLTRDTAIDSTRFGNEVRFVNHSVSVANCVSDTRIVNCEPRIGIFANRHLEVGEELFFNYRYGDLQERFIKEDAKPDFLQKALIERKKLRHNHMKEERKARRQCLLEKKVKVKVEVVE